MASSQIRRPRTQIWPILHADIESGRRKPENGPDQCYNEPLATFIHSKARNEQQTGLYHYIAIIKHQS